MTGCHVSKIIFVNRYFLPDMSATSQMLTDLVQRLVLDNVDIAVITSRQCYENPNERLEPRDRISGVEIYRVWSTTFGRSNLVGRALDYLSFYLTAFIMLLRLAGRNDVIVAKTDPPLISVFAWLAARLKRANLVNWLQDVFPEVAVELGMLPGGKIARMIKAVRNISLRGAAMNVVLGTKMRDVVLAQGVDDSKISVIHNWADGEMIHPVANEDNKLRHEWGLREKFVVGYSGNMGRAHDFETVISAMQLFKGNEKIVFLFIGSGAGKKKLLDAIEEFGIKNCIFKPYQDRKRLSESLSVPDVHLVSLQSQLEGLIVPSKIYGIAAAGRPAIFVGDPESEIANITAEIGCELVVPTGNSDLLVEYILNLSDNPSLAKKCGQEMRIMFNEEYDIRHAITKWEAVFRGVLNNSRIEPACA